MVKRIAIIGGGWAGIAAAVYLTQQKKWAVSLFEAGRALGGRAKNLSALPDAPAAPWTTDNGQHLLIGAYAETFRLMKILKVSPKKVLTELPFYLETPHLLFQHQPPFWHAFLPALFANLLHHLHFLKDAHGLSEAEKNQALRFFLNLKKIPAPPTTAEAWLQNHFSTQSLFFNEFLKPLCTAALNTPIHQASAPIFQSVLSRALFSSQAMRFLIPHSGLSSLIPQPAHQWLIQHGAQLFLSTRILKLEATPAHTWLLHSKNGAMHVDFDAVVLATLPEVAHNLLHPLNLGHLVPLLDFEPVATLYLQFHRPLLLKGLHYVDVPFPAWIIPHAPNGVAVVMSASGPWEKAWEKSTPILALQFQRSIEKRQNAPTGGIAFEKALRIQKAAFCAQPHFKRPNAGRTLHPGLYLAGDYTIGHYPSTLESAVLSGKIAAEHIEQDFPR